MASHASMSSGAARPTINRWTMLLRMFPYMLILIGLLFLPAGTFDWPVAWAYLGIYLLSLLAITFFGRIEQELADERFSIKPDVKAWDKPISLILSIAGLLILPIAGLDRRYGWSPVIPLGVQIRGLALSAAGIALEMWAMKVNRFFTRFVRIQTDRGHTVVTTGPYRFVRHPAYSGGALFLLGTVLALASAVMLIPVAILLALVVVRAALEDRTLQAELPGYKEYAERTRFRLLPGVW